MKFIYVGFGVLCMECGTELREAWPDDRYGDMAHCKSCKKKSPIAVILRVRTDSEESRIYAWNELQGLQEVFHHLLSQFVDEDRLNPDA